MEALQSILFWFTSAVFVVYLYLKYVVYNRWSPKDVPHDPPVIPLGNVPKSYFKGKITHGDIVKRSYMRYRKFRFHGLYMLYEPVLVITDPELLQLVLVKNFSEFYNRGTLSDVHKDPLSMSLVRLYDEKWKRLRAKLTPTFTSGKLKLMYPLIKEICDELVNVCDNALDKSEIVEVKDLVTRYTVDCISSIAFGFNCDSLHNPDSEILKYGKISNELGRVFLLLSFFIPNLTKFVPVPERRKMVGKFFVQLFDDMVASRRKENIVRNDFLNMLIQLMDHGNVQDSNDSSKPKVTEADKITMMEAVGQAFFFFAAGQETSSAAVICCLYELAFNQDVQEKLFKEIYDVYNSPDEVTYEKLVEMKYFDLVYQETLRKYPAATVVNRICVKDFKIPNSSFTIKKGTRLVIPIAGLHWDPEIYPEPDKFQPERFLPENKAKRHNFTYLPFGEGPRQCIGKRLAILKPKMALFHLILNYKFSACHKTAVPMQFMPDYFVQVPGDVYLKVEKRELIKHS